MSKTIEFTKVSAKLFVKEYNKAQKEKAVSFLFDGGEFITGYAYYMIQYLEMKKIVNGAFDNDKIFTHA